VWRSPVYRTPEAVIVVVQLLRLAWRVIWFVLTHPLLDAVAGSGSMTGSWSRCQPSRHWVARRIRARSTQGGQTEPPYETEQLDD